MRREDLALESNDRCIAGDLVVSAASAEPVEGLAIHGTHGLAIHVGRTHKEAR